MRKLLLPVFLGILFILAAFVPMEARTVVINTASIAVDTNFSNNVWGAPNTEADLFYSIDQGTDVNTMSLELEVSPNGSEWYNHTVSPTLLTDNAGDASGYIADIPIHGYQFRIVANVSNTQTVTPNLKIVIR